jgi:hypothetical protein
MKFRWILAGLGIGLFAVAALAAPVRSMPGAVFAGPQGQKESGLRLGRSAAAHLIALSSPAAAERATLKAAPANDKRMPLKIGFTRDVPDRTGHVDLPTLAWQVLPDGRRAARVAIESPSAAAVRIEIAFSGDMSGLRFRFTGEGTEPQVFGPYSSPEIVASGNLSPILDGSTGAMEI